MKLKPVKENIPVTTLAAVEKFGLPEEKKRLVLDIIAQRPLPRNVLPEALREASENPDIDPAAILRNIRPQSRKGLRKTFSWHQAAIHILFN